jgi:hypothetical protein
MNTQQAIFSVLTVLLPVLGTTLPGIFKQDRLSAQANDFIAIIIILIASGLQAWSENQIHLVNPYLDFIVVLAGISSLLAGPMKNIDVYLQSNVGLGSKSAPAPSTTPAQSELTTMLNGLVSVFSQHTQLLATLIPVLQSLQPAQSVPPAQNAPVSTVAPAIHGPSTIAATSTVQPSADGVQASIPAFTSTAEIPVVTPPTA